MAEKYVCLGCIHIWTARSKNARERQCSQCRRRMATSLVELERTVLVVKDWIDAHKQIITIAIAPLHLPPALVSAINLIASINPEFPLGIEILRKIMIIASEYDPKNEDLETCLLRLKTAGKLD